MSGWAEADAEGGAAPDKGYVHSQASMPPAALQAHEYTVGDRRPLRILSLAVHADLQAKRSLSGDSTSRPKNETGRSFGRLVFVQHNDLPCFPAWPAALSAT